MGMRNGLSKFRVGTSSMTNRPDLNKLGVVTDNFNQELLLLLPICVLFDLDQIEIQLLSTCNNVILFCAKENGMLFLGHCKQLVIYCATDFVFFTNCESAKII